MTKGFASFIFLSWLLVSTQAFAITHGYFIGLNSQGMIMLTEQDRTGGNDNDAYHLFEAMDVPIQNSFLGPGKAIVTADRGLNFVCAHRTSGEYQCSITINAGKDGKVSKSNGSIYYKATGDKGIEVSKLFKANSDKGYYFESSDGLFKVWARPTEFILQYQQ